MPPQLPSLTKGAFKLSVDKIVNFVVVLLVIAILVPLGLTTLLDVDTTGWPTLMITIWDFVPIMAILGVLLAVIGFATVKIRGRS